MEELSGVMSLPEAQGPGMSPDQSAIFEQIRQNIPRQEITQELLSAGEQADPQAVAEFRQELAGLQLTPDELNKLNTMVDAILAAPQDYASLRRAYLSEGIPEDLLPEQFDPAFFAALNMALDTIAMNPGSPPPMAMAGGGVASLAAYGRNGDTMLAHITPQEAALLKRMGGSGTINPYTGLPEYASIFKKIGNAVKKFAKSTVGKIIIGAGLAIFGGPVAAGFLSSMAGGSTVLGGFLSSAAGSAAVGGFLAGAGTTLASGGNLKQALKAGAIGGLSGAALAGVTQGMDAFAARPELLTPPDIVGQAGGGLGEPGVTVNRGVGTAADLAGTPDAASRVLPGGTRISPQMNLAVSNYADAQGAFQSPATGSLTPSDLAAPPALNTGSGTYDPGGTFTQGQGAAEIIDKSRTLQAPRPGILESLGKGDFRGAYEQLTPSYRSEQGFAEAINRAKSMLGEGAATSDVIKLAEKLAPGALSTYAPLAALGVGALALGGGFKPEQPQMPDMFKGPTGSQLLLMNPGQYGLRFGGVMPGYSSAYQYGPSTPPPKYADGGGVMALPQAMRVGGKTYPRKTGPINGPGTGTSDSIPAMLSDGEFVFTAKAVRAMGNGSRRKGAKKMYKLMKMLEGKAA